MFAGAGRREPRPRKRAKVSVPKKIAKAAGRSARANKLAGLVFGAFLLAIGAGRARRARYSGKSRARRGGGDRPSRVYRQRLSDRRPQAHEPRAGRRGRDRRAAPGCRFRRTATRRRRLWSTFRPSAIGCCGFGWVKDARVSRRLPDTLVIDIVERKPAALWQNEGRLALIDCRGSRARPRAGRQDARSAAGYRPWRQWRGAAARAADGGGSDAEAAACLRDLGRRAALGSESSSRARRWRFPKAKAPPARR